MMRTRFALPSTLVVLMLVALATIATTGADDAHAATYDVGPGQPLATVGAVPWATLGAGDVVRIHYRAAPYAEKFVICRQGAAGNPITITGVLGPGGERPILTGNNAITAPGLNYWRENRGVIKIGGANTPPDTLPMYITIENLEIRSAHPNYTYTDDGGNPGQVYADNAAAIDIEKGHHIVIRNCEIHDCGNGLFAAGDTADLTVEGCYIYGNGIVGSIYEHNTYLESNGILYQYNRYGPLRSGALGNNLKDRSGNCVIRYNWIEAGNRQCDLVESDYAAITGAPGYGTSYVYGNVLIEPDGAGNRQIVHFGGDGGGTYRSQLYFHHNTVVSTRNDRTTLFRASLLATNIDARNNIVYCANHVGNDLSFLAETGTLTLTNNWCKTGPPIDSHDGSFNGTVTRNGMIYGASPGFENEGTQDWRLATGSPCIDQGGAMAGGVSPTHDAVRTYLRHIASEARAPTGTGPDLGAYEFGANIDAPTGPVNQPPVAVAAITGPGTVGNVHTLDGTASNDPDTGPSALTYQWTQTGGPSITISGATSATATFTPTSVGTYDFMLTVDDGADTDTDTVSIAVTDPALTLDTSTWNLAVNDSTAFPVTDTRTLTYGGTGTLTVTVSTNQSWVTAAFDNGSGGNTLAASASGTITITLIGLTGLVAGANNATLTVTGNDGIVHTAQINIVVTYTVGTGGSGGSGGGGGCTMTPNGTSTTAPWLALAFLALALAWRRLRA